jgi:hypothetical protein
MSSCCGSSRFLGSGDFGARRRRRLIRWPRALGCRAFPRPTRRSPRHSRATPAGGVHRALRTVCGMPPKRRGRPTTAASVAEQQHPPHLPRETSAAACGSQLHTFPATQPNRFCPTGSVLLFLPVLFFCAYRPMAGCCRYPTGARVSSDARAYGEKGGELGHVPPRVQVALQAGRGPERWLPTQSVES